MFQTIITLRIRYLKEVEHTEEVRYERVAKKFNRFFSSGAHDHDGALALESAINHDIELHWLSILQLWWMGSLASAFDSAESHGVSSEACSVASGSVEFSQDAHDDETQARVQEQRPPPESVGKSPTSSVHSSPAASEVKSVHTAAAGTGMGLQGQVQPHAAQTEKKKSSAAASPANPAVLLASATAPPTLSSVATLGIVPKPSRDAGKAPTSRDYLERGTGTFFSCGCFYGHCKL